jgi:hypothetical protein
MPLYDGEVATFLVAEDVGLSLHFGRRGSYGILNITLLGPLVARPVFKGECG